MIILRQKEYASLRKKAQASLMRAGSKVMAKIDNAGLKAGNKVIGTVTGKPRVAKVVFQPASKTKIAREVIKPTTATGKFIANPGKVIKSGAKTAAAKTTRAAQNVAYNTGGVIDKGVEMAVKNPISTVSQAGSTAFGTALTAANPAAGTAYMACPVGPSNIGMVAEQALKRKNPGYAKWTEKLGNKYKNSKLSKAIREKTPSFVDISQFAGQYGL